MRTSIPPGFSRDKLSTRACLTPHTSIIISYSFCGSAFPKIEHVKFYLFYHGTMFKMLNICVSMYVLLCKYILPWINFAPSLVIMSSLFLSTSQQLISRNDPYSRLNRMIPYKPSSPPPWKRYHLMKIYEFWMLILIYIWIIYSFTNIKTDFFFRVFCGIPIVLYFLIFSSPWTIVAKAQLNVGHNWDTLLEDSLICIDWILDISVFSPGIFWWASSSLTIVVPSKRRICVE